MTAKSRTRLPRDFHRAQYQNPFERRKPKTTPPPSPWRNKIAAILLFLVCGAWFGVLFWHPYFTIRKVESVEGANRIPASALVEIAQQYLTQKVLGVLPHNNYFLASKKGLERALKNRYAFDEVEVVFRFPHEVIIRVKEKPRVFVAGTLYGEWFFADRDGQVIERADVPHNEILKTISLSPATAPTSTAIAALRDINSQYPDLLTLVLSRNTQAPIGESLISASMSKKIGAIDALLKENKIQPLFYLRPTEELPELDLITAEGWGIYLNLNDNETEVISRLATLLKTKLKERKYLHYVDLRFGDRVYFQ